ncbi:hypothetical protein B0H13DRAFT_2325269 [Mycena leptocephala]|nr:hypothetical protein B0H13DRAFT_2325269 [Mycena leptocephala]
MRTLTLGIRIPHFCSIACLKCAPSLTLLHRSSVPSALLLPRPRSLASYPSHRDGPCAAPLLDRDFGACPHAHYLYILDTGLYSTLDFAPHSPSIDLTPHARRSSRNSNSLCTSGAPPAPPCCVPSTPPLPSLVLASELVYSVDLAIHLFCFWC